MLETTMSTKGQVVIPAEIRRRRKLEPSAKFEVRDTEEGILLVPRQKHDWRRSRGMLKKYGDRSALDDWAEYKREERELEEAKWRRFDGDT